MPLEAVRGDPSQLASLLQRWAYAAFESSRAAQGGERAGAPAHVAFDAAAEAVRGFVQHVLLGVAYDCNSRCPLVALPLQLLRPIFRFVGQDDRWPVSQTCRRLRTYCLGTPSLWRTTLPQYRWHARPATPSFASRFSLLAQRSLPDDLNFQLAFLIDSAGGAETVSALLMPLMHRLRFIGILSLAQSDGFRVLLETPAPVLEEVFLASLGAGEGYRPMDLPFGLFAGRPNLRVMELRNVQLPGIGSTCPDLSSIRSFSWEHLFSLEVDTAMFCHILTLMPRLEVLRLSVCGFAWNSSAVDIVVPRGLWSFTLYADQEASASHLVSCLRDISSITHFCCLSARPAVLSALLDDLAGYKFTAYVGPVVSEISVPAEALGRPIVIRGDVRTLFRASETNWEMIFLPSPIGAGSLTRLSLHEFYWPTVGSFPSFPHLLWLRITLSTCFAFRMSPYAYRDSILAGRDVAVCDAPLLETVVISHVVPPKSCGQADVFIDHPFRSELLGLATCFCTRRTLPVCLYDIHLFLCAYVLRPGQQLAHLALEGIEAVDHDPWAALELLQGIAHDVTISSVAEPVSCDCDQAIQPDDERP